MKTFQHTKLRVHLHVIDQDVARFVARHRDAIHCEPGCGSCCYQTFRISELEGELIREGLAALEKGKDEYTSGRLYRFLVPILKWRWTRGLLTALGVKL